MRVALLIEYHGKNFHGSQYQANARTVQAELERALSIWARAQVATVFSGRTDAGVHARAQVVHLDWPLDDLDLWRLCWSLNGILPQDLSVTGAKIVPESFHARFSATSRQYVYRILNRPQRSALLKDTHYFVPFTLDLEAMRAGARLLIGVHDFSAFKSSNSDKVNAVCHVTRSEILKVAEGKLEFWIAANHFVYNMVRILVGTLVEIGLGKRTPADLSSALEAKDRNLAGPTAPSWGLCLDSIEYPDVYQIFCSESRFELAGD